MTIAVAQLHIVDGDVAVNAGRCQHALDDAAATGADLLVLPECALTGYQFGTRGEALAASIATRDPRLQALGAAAAPGEFEIDVFAHRRPDLYGSFTHDQEQ